MVKKEYYKSAYVIKDKHWEEQFKLQHNEARRQDSNQSIYVKNMQTITKNWKGV